MRAAARGAAMAGALPHWVGGAIDPGTAAALAASLGPGAVVEARCFDDRQRRQGTCLLLCLGVLNQNDAGCFISMEHLAASDVYYEWWIGATYRAVESPLALPATVHFCAGPMTRCQVPQPPGVIHCDAWRALTPVECESLPWIRARHHESFRQVAAKHGALDLTGTIFAAAGAGPAAAAAHLR